MNFCPEPLAQHLCNTCACLGEKNYLEKSLLNFLLEDVLEGKEDKEDKESVDVCRTALYKFREIRDKAKKNPSLTEVVTVSGWDFMNE